VAGASIFERAGGAPAFSALAAAHHRRCLEDPELSHAFEQMANPRHVEALADYWAEVFGGPPRYSDAGLGQSGMLALHAGQGAGSDFGSRFAVCFAQAIDDAGLSDDAELRQALTAYMAWAVDEVVALAPPGATVAPRLPTPRWGWHGLETSV
jgi:hemoglobin